MSTILDADAISKIKRGAFVGPLSLERRLVCESHEALRARVAELEAEVERLRMLHDYDTEAIIGAIEHGGVTPRRSA